MRPRNFTQTAWLGLLAASLAGCSDDSAPGATPAPGTPGGPPAPTVVPPRDTVTGGTATPVDPGQTLPPWHPTTPLSDPTLNNGVGRAPHRINVAQLRASFQSAIGVTWREPRRVLTAESPSGSVEDPDADMLSILSATLGEPNYDQATQESLDPSATFSKLIGDAARKACRDGVTADVARGASQRILLRYANPTDTAAGNEAAVRRNLQYLVLRFWARSVETNSAAVSDLLRLFTVASTVPAQAMLPAGAPPDGWRAVCIALATDPQFLTY
ncbi:MAG: hypothetical protein JNK72_23220 [Myxococcales bacterium]|nr:hypothetical protein [Myxococcales bacterium]